MVLTRPSIAFLSFACEPTRKLPVASASDASKVAQAESVRSLAQALSELQDGWQVDLFTCEEQSDLASTIWIAPHCRVIRIPVDVTATPMQQASRLAQTIPNFQLKEGLLWPLFHSFDHLSGQVGHYLKQQKGWRWLHNTWQASTPLNWQTSTSLNRKNHLIDLSGRSSFLLADQHILFQQRGHEVLDAGSKSRDRSIADNQDVPSWAMLAARMDAIYRQHLALYVGATKLEIPKVASLLLPTHSKEMLQGERGIAQSANPTSASCYSYPA